MEDAGTAGVRVLVEHDGEQLPGTILWTYLDHGRERALVRFETAGGFVRRELRWRDEIVAAPAPQPRVIALPMEYVDTA